jgi:hypothetical protein
VIEDEDESTRASAGGQLPKFGALKKSAQSILRDMWCGRKFVKMIDSAKWSAMFSVRRNQEKEFAATGRNDFHKSLHRNADRKS